MKLSTKTMLILVGMMVALILALHLVSTRIVHKGFAQLEDHHARQNVTRALRAIEECGRTLGNSATDWATWDDAYKFVDDRNEAFLKSNINAEALKSLQIEFLLIVDAKGTLAAGAGYNLEDAKELPIPAGLLRLAAPGSTLDCSTAENGKNGLVLIAGKPMIVAARPILTSQKQGPSHGTVILGYYLDKERLGGLSDALQLPIFVFGTDEVAAASPQAAIVRRLAEGGSCEISIANAKTLNGYGLIRDLNDLPALLVEVGLPRDIFSQGLKTSLLFTGMLILVGVCFSIAMVLILRWQIIARLELLSRKIGHIAITEDFAQRIHLRGSDELAAVANDINRLLATVVESRQALVTSEERFRQIAENVVDCIWETDIDGLYTYVSPAIAKILGYQPKELIGQLHFYDLFVEEERDSLRLAARQAINDDGRVHNMINNNLHQDGHLVVLETSVVPVLDPMGNRLGYRGISRDITERQQAQAELHEHREHLAKLVELRTAELVDARNQAEAANRAKSAFLSNMSHELRTPLNAVLGFAQVMSRDPVVFGKQKANLAVILRSGEHLLALINDILDITKIEAGRIELELREFDLIETIGEVVDMMRDRAESKGLQLVAELPSGLPRFIRADSGKFRQILINLVGNAIKFTKTGEVRITVSVVEALEPSLAVEVRDTGIGIAESDRQRLFIPFEQVGDNKTFQQGTGLGLAICRQYVQLMKGEISVASAPGQGSCFRFTIPLKVADAGTEPGPQPAHRVVGIKTPVDKLRILIVDDNSDNRHLFRSFLEIFGFHLREAVDGHDGIMAFLDWQPHLVFMDRRMPVLDGLEAVRQIRQLPGGEHVIIVAVTAHALAEERRIMLAAGCDDFLAKPFQENQLFAILKKHLHLDLIYVDEMAAPMSEENRKRLLAASLGSLEPAVLRNVLRLAIEGQLDDLVDWATRETRLSAEAREIMLELLESCRFEVLQEILKALVDASQPSGEPGQPDRA
jgi:PAS domain S-box-containing protein